MTTSSLLPNFNGSMSEKSKTKLGAESMNLELKARVVDAYLGVVDINGFKYNMARIQVSKLDDVPCLFPVYMDIYPGDCFVSDKWVLTCLHPKKKPMDIIIRVDEFEQCSEDGFEVSEYINSKVVGLFCISSKCVLKEVGVDRVPFFNATLKVKNAFKESFDMYILGFQKVAKQMSSITGGSVIECVVTAKRKLQGDGWEFPVSNITVKQEGKI